MARKTTTTKKLESDVESDLAESLEFDLNDQEIDLSASMAELEAQISAAAEELAREGRGDEEEPKAESQPKTREKQTPAAKADTPVAKDASRADLRPATPEPAAGAARPSFAPANDDRQKNYTSMLATLNQRPSGTVYWIAATLSVLWISAGLALGHYLFAPAIWQVRSFDQLLATPGAIAIAAGVLVPVLLFWAFAVMVRRAQEMRLAAQSMTEVAFRLVDPEALSQERIMTVSQAVRREVQAMGEGIERTLARAVELETLVHTEVNELENAYSENERRIRLLVDGLGTEREAVISHAERVRASIAGAHELIRDELNSASDLIQDTVSNASGTLNSTIATAGETLLAQIGERGDTLQGAIDERVETIASRISVSGEAFASLLDERIVSLTEKTETAARSLSDLLDERTSGMVSLLGASTETLTREFDGRLQEIERTLAERGQSLISEFETRAQAVDNGAEKLNAALEARARQINET
ncbi:MAG: kinesin, partial [Nitratireductor sp.]